jgi:hypothetical protein
MGNPWTVDVAWWITAVEIPALAGLCWMVWRNRRDADLAIGQGRAACEEAVARLRDNLAAYKLEVAKSYASIAYLREVEKRLTGHLLRIEDKLDGVGPRRWVRHERPARSAGVPPAGSARRGRRHPGPHDLWRGTGRTGARPEAIAAVVMNRSAGPARGGYWWGARLPRYA